VDTGLARPGDPSIGGADVARLMLAVLFSLMGVAGIHLMARYRPSDALG
jgi:hypothetical protein